MTDKYQSVVKETFNGGGQKEIKGKLRLDLIPPEVEEAYAEVLGEGATKYADRNWEKGIPYTVCIGALRRHLLKFTSSHYPDNDDETGLHHAYCVAWWANALVTFIKRNRDDLDDRPSHYPAQINTFFEFESDEIESDILDYSMLTISSTGFYDVDGVTDFYEEGDPVLFQDYVHQHISGNDEWNEDK